MKQLIHMRLCHVRILKPLVIQAQGAAPTHYFEVDFPEVTKKKAAIIANREALHKLLGPNLDAQDISKLDVQHHAVMCTNYHITACLQCHCCGLTITRQNQPSVLKIVPMLLDSSCWCLVAGVSHSLLMLQGKGRS